MISALKTLLGIEIPLIQAPMAGVQNWELAHAVAQAGALGSIPCGMLNAGQVVSEIEQFTQHSDKPYNLNFFCHTMPKLDQHSLANWEDKLKPYYEELSVSPPLEISGLRRPFDAHMAEVLEQYKPPVMSFHFGLPTAELVKRIKSWGTVILSSATTVEEGVWLQEHGADIVIAQGSEAGGHRAMFLSSDPDTQRLTKDLVAELSKKLTVPIVAAGGIATGLDIQKMLDLGASGAQIGTSYLLCQEAKTSAVHRQALKDLDAPTELTNVFSGRLARGICNRFMQDLGYINNDAPKFPYAAVGLGPLRSKSESQGLSDFTPLWSGTRRNGCQEISATELTKQLWTED